MPEDKNIDWERLLQECLDSTIVMTLATHGKNGIWSTPVYFSYDERFNLYFISAAETRHMKDIRDDQNVAASIFTPPASSGVYQIGIQIEGVASTVPDENIEEVYANRSRRINSDATWIQRPNEGRFVKEHGGVFIKISPTSVNYFNTKYLGSKSRKVTFEKLKKGI